MGPEDGYFFPACYIHTDFHKWAPLIKDVSGNVFNYGRAFATWYTQNSSFRLEDTCGLLCGTCPNSPWWDQKRMLYMISCATLCLTCGICALCRSRCRCYRRVV